MDHDGATSAVESDKQSESMTALDSSVAWLRRVTSVTPTHDQEEALDELIPRGDEFAPYLRRFAMLTVLSASIAAFGLLSDSAAVVIGAMLVAPLMVPITAAAAATVRAQNDVLVRSVLVIFLGVALAIAVGAITCAVAGFDIVSEADLPDQVSQRTFPGLLDLGVAITAGAAAGYISTRRATTSALPGVGIAVALVPPLATVGILLQLGLHSAAQNAFLLFLTNLAAIIFAASVMLLLSGFRPQEERARRSVRHRLAFTVLAVAAVAIPLTLHTQATVRDSNLRRAVTQSVQVWDSSVRVVELTADVADGTAHVELIVAGPNDVRPAWKLADLVRGTIGQPVDLELRYERDELYAVSSR